MARTDKELAQTALAAVMAGRALSTPEQAITDTGLTNEELARAQAYLADTDRPILGQ